MAHTQIYTLSLHDALPIYLAKAADACEFFEFPIDAGQRTISRFEARHPRRQDRKSTRLNSSHRCISYAVFCLNKKQRHAGIRVSGLGSPLTSTGRGREQLA